jgi:hypothetical protein
MFILSNYNIWYLLIILVLLIKLSYIENEKNNVYYLFKYYNPKRYLYDKNSLNELYQEAYRKYFIQQTSSKENFHIFLESTVAELLIHLFNEKINTSDSYIKIHIETKINLLFKNYEILYDIDDFEKEEIYISLMFRMIDILSEVHGDIFNLYLEINKFLKNKLMYYGDFENYIMYRNKIDLNYEKITFKKENLIRYSGEFKNNNLKFSKWMYFPQINTTN